MSVPLRRRLFRLSAAALAISLAVPAIAAGQASAAEQDAGTIHLTVTTPDGSPARGMVVIVPLDGEDGPWLELDETGQVSADVSAGNYKIQITPAPGGDPGLTDDSLALCHRWLAEIGVAATPGIDFDPVRGQRTVRFSFAGRTPDMVEAVHRLQRWVAHSG